VDRAELRRGIMEGRPELPRVGSVSATGNASVPFELLDPDGQPVDVVSEWVRELLLGDASPRTARAYCHCLLTWFRLLWVLGVDWERATEAETAVLVGWLRSAPNPQRRRRPTSSPAGSVNPVTGKQSPAEGYSRSTINLTLAAVSGFYAHHARSGLGPVVNPVPVSPARRQALAHRSPIEPAAPFRRARLRQKAVVTGPRSIPDGRWVELFAAVDCDRDRALLACFVSSGARASELLAAVVGDVDWAEQRISVTAKGGARRLVPVSPEALLWLSRHLGDAGRSGPSGLAGLLGPETPLWQTRRGAERRLSYPALRRVLQRANERLGADWTWHDLRHTAAARMVNDGSLTLPEVQVVLGHADLRTTSRYTVPRMEELFDRLNEFYARPPVQARPAVGYDPEDLAVVFGG
jgi:integrase